MMDNQIVTLADARKSGAARYFTGKPCRHGHVALRETASKTCTECRKTHSATYESKTPGRVRAWIDQNKDHVRLRLREYKHANRKRVNEWNALSYRRHRAEKLAKAAAWREQNRERHNTMIREWGARNKDKRTATAAKRRALQRCAIPLWVDFDAVTAIYQAARECTAVSGMRHEVDHVVPLVHPLVCGLHWAGNLQVLTSFENRRKSNRRWPDMAGLNDG